MSLLWIESQELFIFTIIHAVIKPDSTCVTENPTEFLLEQLKLLKLCQQSGGSGPNLFNNSDLDSVFGILDPAHQGYITFAQYKHGEYSL